MPGIAVILTIGGGIVGALLFQQWAKQAGPQRTQRVLRNLAIAVGILLLLWLLVRSGPAIAAFFAVLFPILYRALQWWLRLRGLTQAFKSTRQSPRRPTGPSQYNDNDQSSIKTRFLQMTLDHDSGEMQGQVIDGRFSGRDLADLTLHELLELWQECQADAQSGAVLEAYLDRTQDADWREQVAAQQNRQQRADSDLSASDTMMSAEEAYAILGLSPGATPAEIKTAHRRLMQKIHPDHGGSDYLAMRVNQAKDLLLNE